MANLTILITRGLSIGTEAIFAIGGISENQRNLKLKLASRLTFLDLRVKEEFETHSSITGILKDPSPNPSIKPN
jgi:acetate kinase